MFKDKELRKVLDGIINTNCDGKLYKSLATNELYNGELTVLRGKLSIVEHRNIELKRLVNDLQTKVDLLYKHLAVRAVTVPEKTELHDIIKIDLPTID